MKCLVTGGAGFIGSHLAEGLVRKGHRVRILDNYSTGKRENILGFADKVEVMEGDIRNVAALREAVDGVEVIFHEAALPSVPRSISDPITSNEVNTTGTLNVLTVAKDAKTKRVVFASSSSVYGNNPELPKHEGMVPNPLSPYAVSKLAGEKYCSVFFRAYGLETVALRYFNVFGPRQDPLSQYSAVIPRFITAMIAGKQPIIYGDGEQSRDFTFVENIVEANILAATNGDVTELLVNCGSHGRVTINDLVRALNEIIGTQLEPIYEKPRSGDVKHSFASIDLAARMLGFAPRVGFKEGLEHTVKWYVDRLRKIEVSEA